MGGNSASADDHRRTGPRDGPVRVESCDRGLEFSSCFQEGVRNGLALLVAYRVRHGCASGHEPDKSGSRSDVAAVFFAAVGGDPRSEEQTSEIQSLMRISYAVFCLKKK